MSLNENIFVNKDIFHLHFEKTERKRRIRDFEQLYNILKKHLVPKIKPTIDKHLLNKYINAHKKENREVIKKVISLARYITFEKFYDTLKKQIERFNGAIDNKKYILVLGASTNTGGSFAEFSIYKSNFWTILLAYKYLKTKPYDIIFNLNVAIKLYYPEIKTFVLMDDCSYSGMQLVDNVLTISATELFFHHKKSFINIGDIADKQIYEPILDRDVDIHLIVPFISEEAYSKICKSRLLTSLNFIEYYGYIIKNYKSLLTKDELDKMSKLYTAIRPYWQFNNLVPAYFDHKIADDVSTISIILIKGVVMDNPTKRIVFIKPCIYNKNKPELAYLDPKKLEIQKKVECPMPPYKLYQKIVEQHFNPTIF